MCPTGIKRLRESVTARAVARLIWAANGDYIFTRTKVAFAVARLREIRNYGRGA